MLRRYKMYWIGNDYLENEYLKFFQPYRAKNLNNLNKSQNWNLITLFYCENTRRFHWDVACYVDTKCIELEMIIWKMNIWNSSNLIVLKTLITWINSPNRNLITLFYCGNTRRFHWDVACYVDTKCIELQMIIWKMNIWNSSNLIVQKP